MSDTEQPAEVSTIPTSELLGAVHVGYDRGDRDRATALDREYVRRQEGDPDGEGEAVYDPGPTEAPEPVDLETAEGVAGVLAETVGGQELVDAWGGVESPEFAENLGYARLASEHLGEKYTDAVDLLGTPLWNPDTEQWVTLGDSPGIIQLAAQFGRQMHHRDGLEPPTIARRKQPEKSNDMTEQNAGGLTAREQLNDLIAKQAALPSGPARNRLQRQIEAVSKQISGDQPIVGGGGRTA